MSALTLAIVLALASPISMHATLTPQKAAGLEPVTVAISLQNHSRLATTLEFPTADLFFVQIRDAKGEVLFDSRSGHKPIEVHRKLFVPIGMSTVADFIWNGLDDQQHALLPGNYVVHVEMGSVTAHLTADLPFVLEAPAGIATVLSSKPRQPVTVSGAAMREGGVTYLQDDTGRIAISTPLGLHPQGDYVVRGIFGDLPGGQGLRVSRFAPAAGNLAPEATPTPLPSPTPTLPVPHRSG